ncbi:MAG: molybdate ABC transporter substrate-binding protein [Myxococcales bacterium]|nr:molybdate ABC transporter substrate-binding protein [Myxococcales bacterium]MCB9643043.1 molybdate ABC transporter substrate-binding protein [Myxococcales bacterium]
MLAVFVLWGSMAACQRQSKQPPCTLRIALAASLTLAFQKLAKDFEPKAKCRIQLDIGSSGILLRKIQRGAPFDLFFSADLIPAKSLHKLDLRNPPIIRDFASNRLVLLLSPQNPFQASWIPAKTAAAAIPDALRSWLMQPTTRMVLGDPTHVPAGRYARDALHRIGLWAHFQKTAIRATHVRAALRTLLQGHAQVAIVYESDALSAPKARILYKFSPQTNLPIRYQVATLRQSPQVQSFLRYLQQPSSRQILQKAGFLPPLTQHTSP